MDEYIKREDALDAVLFALVGTGLQSTAIYALRDIPTADVAPKSEVAREIFAELLKEASLRFDGFRNTIIFPLDYYNELKKKYTEGRE